MALFALSPERIQLSNFDKQHHVKLLREEALHLKAQLQGIEQQYDQCEQQIRQIGANVVAGYAQTTEQKNAQFESNLDLVYESIAFLEQTQRQGDDVCRTGGQHRCQPDFGAKGGQQYTANHKEKSKLVKESALNLPEI